VTSGQRCYLGRWGRQSAVEGTGDKEGGLRLGGVESTGQVVGKKVGKKGSDQGESPKRKEKPNVPGRRMLLGRIGCDKGVGRPGRFQGNTRPHTPAMKQGVLDEKKAGRGLGTYEEPKAVVASKKHFHKLLKEGKMPAPR